MPPKSLNKIQKQISKKKGAKITALHENSRDSKRLQRAGARDDRLNKLATMREKANRPHLNRIGFFLVAAKDLTNPLSTPDIHSLIETYVSRNDRELEQLKAERRPGRPPNGREGILKQGKELEEKEFTSGFWMPDLSDAEGLKKLKDWNGEWASLALLKYIRLDRKGTKRESSFPPKGQS